MDPDNALQVDLNLQVAYNSNVSGHVASSGTECVTSVELWAAAKNVPYIFSSPGGRQGQHFVIDRKLHSATSIDHLFSVTSRTISNFDPGNAVVAFCQASKLVDEGMGARLCAYGVWRILLAQLKQCAEVLEPRGLSMLSYSCAKLDLEDTELLESLAATGVRRARDFGIMDIAKMCWGLAKMGVQQVSFWRAMEAEVLVQKHQGREHDLSMIVWSFATAGHGCEDLFGLLAQSMDSMPHLCPQSLSNLVWAYGTMRFSDAVVVSKICHRSLAVIHDFGEFDVANLSWALAQLNLVDDELFKHLADHTVRSGIWKRMPAMKAAQTAWAFAVARYCHTELFSALSEFVCRHAAVLETHQLSTFAWSFAAVRADVPEAFHAMAFCAQAGNLWNFEHDELCALFWGFVRSACWEEHLVDGFVRVIFSRIHECDSEDAARLLSSLTSLHPAATSKTGFHEVVDAILAVVVQGILYGTFVLDEDAKHMAASSLRAIGRAADASAISDLKPSPS